MSAPVTHPAPAGQFIAKVAGGFVWSLLLNHYRLQRAGAK